jgi:hypothetical protein
MEICLEPARPFAAFPDGRHDDQVDTLCNVAANLELVTRWVPFGERFGFIRPIPRGVPPTPPKSEDQDRILRAAVGGVAALGLSG